MVLAPVELADVKAVSTGIAIIRQPGSGPQVEVPVELGGHRLGRAETLRPEDGPAIAIGVNGLKLANTAAAHKFTGAPELAVVFAALLGAGLIDPPITPNRRQHSLALADSHCARFLAIHVFASGGGHRGHSGMPVGRGGD